MNVQVKDYLEDNKAGLTMDDISKIFKEADIGV
jgi:hypothetical protein